jgi:hypothetical protein
MREYFYFDLMDSEMASPSMRGFVRGCFLSCGAGGAGGGGASIAKRGFSSSSLEVSAPFNMRRSRRAAWLRASI